MRRNNYPKRRVHKKSRLLSGVNKAICAAPRADLPQHLQRCAPTRKPIKSRPSERKRAPREKSVSIIYLFTSVCQHGDDGKKKKCRLSEPAIEFNQVVTQSAPRQFHCASSSARPGPRMGELSTLSHLLATSLSSKRESIFTHVSILDRNELF